MHVLIAVGGENLIDLIQSNAVADDATFVAAPGGSCYNCALALGRFGAQVSYVTPISSDGFGEKLANRLEDSNVVVAADRVSNPTSMAVVSFKNGQPSYQFYRERTAERCIDADKVISLCIGDRAFHIGGLGLVDGVDGDVWVDVAFRLKEQGVIISLDPNVRPTLINDRHAYRQRLDRMLDIADILKLSDEDLCWLYPDGNIDESFATLREKTSARLVVLTKGAEGAELTSGPEHVLVPALKGGEIVDTVGAGDTFMAALLASVDHLRLGDEAGLDRDTLTWIGAFAAQAAGINCQREGCDPPWRQELSGTAKIFG